MGLSYTPWALLGWRTLQGVISGVFPAAVALLTALTPAPRVSRALARLQSARAAGTLCGPLLGGLLADLFGIRPLFFVVGGIALAMALLSSLTLFEAPRHPHQATTTAPGPPWRSLLGGPNLLFLALLGLQQGAVMCAWPTLALFVTELGVPGESVATLTGFVIFAHSLPVIFLAGRWTAAAERIGSDGALFAALVASGALGVAIGVAVRRIEALIALRVLSGLAMAGFGPLLFERLGRAVPAEARGRVAGLGSTAMMIGSLLGPVTGGWLAVHLGLGATFWVPGAAMIVTGVLLAWRARAGQRVK
jgi:DHA1 family multidrug resistance protein-like MFS transporter